MKRKVYQKKKVGPGQRRGQSPATLRAVISAWELHTQGAAWDRPEPYRELGRQALDFGHATLAYEIFRHGLAAFPADAGLDYLTALAQAKFGAFTEASRRVAELQLRLKKTDSLYADAKSLEGRIAKDRWARTPQGMEKDGFGRRAAEAYEAAYRNTHEFFPGINAATMHMLTGEQERGRDIAQAVRQRCLKRLQKASTPDHWLLATLGEACLLLDDRAEALLWYRKAARIAKNRAGTIATMRRQLKLLETAVKVDPELYKVLRVPRVVVFSGHMLDEPNREIPRFPELIEKEVGRQVAECLRKFDVGFGYCSAACGADIIFIEQMLKRGAEVHVTLPFEQREFLQTSVSFAGPRWIERFNKAIQRSTSINYAVQERYLGDDVLFGYTSSLTQGAALLRASQLETDVMMLVVLDETQDGKLGGTRSALAAWSKVSRPVRKIDLKVIREQTAGAVDVPPPAVRSARLNSGKKDMFQTGVIRREIKTMLFADMVGFSRLEEQDTPAFLLHFLGEIARVITDNDVTPAFLNTWGDGLYMVFDGVAEAANFALKLRDTVRGTDWKASGLPEDTNIRIGIHSGPVFPSVDPIIHRNNFFGSHVNRAARIEPVTAPGTVYVSEQTASLLAASGAIQFTCEFLGSIPLAKRYGEGVLYRLRRSTESE